MEDCIHAHQLDVRHGLTEVEIRQLAELHGSFEYHHQTLRFRGLNLQKFQEQQVAPSLIYDLSRICENLKVLQGGWTKAGHRPRVFFAMKCCYLSDVLRAVRDAGHGVEVMSDLELQIALQADFAPQDIVIGGTAKSATYLEHATALAPALIVLDSLEDAKGLAWAACSTARPLKVALRLIPSDPRAESAFILPDGKLGMRVDSDELAQAFAVLDASKQLELTGIHSHVMTHCQDPEQYGMIARSLAQDILFLRSQFGFSPEIVNLGGGLDTRFLLARHGTSADDFANAAARELAQLGSNFQIYLEPGRFVAADAAIGLGRIVGRKQQGARRWMISDLSSNVLIPLPDIGYPPLPLTLAPPGDIWRSVDIADATCAPSHICRHCPLPNIKVGDSLAFANCGAYTSVFSELWAFALPNIWMLESDGHPRQVFGPENQQAMYRALYGTDLQFAPSPRLEMTK